MNATDYTPMQIDEKLYGTQSLNHSEMKEIEGGWIIPVVIGAIVAAAANEIVSDWDNFERGLVGLPEAE
ncbi:MAG: hypothetical protein ABJ387_12035 [Balneola sp.]